MKKIFLILLILAGEILNAQSYHFSQFYSTPLLVNPAFTGNTDGSFRVASNYRSQWSSSDEPYTTMAVSFEASPLRKRLATGNRLGFGLSVLNDKTMAGTVQYNQVAFSTAYNLSLDDEQVHHAGLGLQVAYKQRRIDFSGLTFENQLGSGGFDPSLPTGETMVTGTKSFFDLNAGLLYSYSEESRSFFAGASVFNILRQKDLFIESESVMPKRYSFTGGGRFDVGVAGIINLSVNYQSQGPVSETTVGASYGIQLGDLKKQVVSLGAWHRINDAIVPYLGYQLNGFQAGFSYDYTVSKIKTSAQVRNGFEISLLYTAPDNSEMRRLVPWY